MARRLLLSGVVLVTQRSSEIAQEPTCCGQPLDRLFDAPLQLEARLRISISLCAALGRVHQRGVTQGTLDPAHVLVNVDTDQAWLPPHRQHARPMDDLAGLGGLLQELFTWRLGAGLADVPCAVLAIVRKLRAEDGYQTAAGVENDLRRCLECLRSLGRIERFRLGAHDGPERLKPAVRLVGCAHERAELLQLFDAVAASGAPAVALVSGAEESSLPEAVGPRGQVVVARCDRYKAGIPHAALAEAFQILLQRALSGGEAQVAGLRRSIREAVGQDGQLLIDLLPAAEFLIGRQRRPQPLAAKEARQRFARVFGAFAATFARAGQPLVLVLDDAQWLDAASAALLQTWLGSRNVLLVLAVRQGDAAAPLVRMLAALRGPALHDLRLPQL